MGDAEGTEVYLHVYDLWQGQVPLNSIGRARACGTLTAQCPELSPSIIRQLWRTASRSSTDTASRWRHLARRMGPHTDRPLPPLTIQAPRKSTAQGASGAHARAIRGMRVCGRAGVLTCGQVFREYLSAASEEYTPESYHLFWHNCNTFSNDVSEFLVGGSIASEIVDLPARFLQTPLGQTFGPMIESMFTPAATRSLATYRTVAELAEDGGEVDQQA